MNGHYAPTGTSVLGLAQPREASVLPRGSAAGSIPPLTASQPATGEPIWLPGPAAAGVPGRPPSPVDVPAVAVPHCCDGSWTDRGPQVLRW